MIVENFLSIETQLVEVRSLVARQRYQFKEPVRRAGEDFHGSAQTMAKSAMVVLGVAPRSAKLAASAGLENKDRHK